MHGGVLLVTFVAALAGASTAIVQAADWARTDKPAYGFSAAFPSTPNEQSSLENGVKTYSLSAGDGDVLCFVIRGEYPYVVNPDVELVAGRDNFANEVHAAVTTSKRTTFKRGIKALQALEFDATRPSHDFRSIIVVDGSYTYQVVGAVSKTNGDPKNLERCVRAFALTP